MADAGFKEIKFSHDSPAGIRIFRDRLEFFVGTQTFATMSSKGLVESGAKVATTGNDQKATGGGMFTGAKDLDEIIKPKLSVVGSSINLTQVRQIKPPITPIINLVKYTAFMAGMGIAIRAANESTSAAIA